MTQQFRSLRFLMLLLVVSGVLVGMTLRANRQTSDIIVLKLAHGLDTTHPVHQAMLFMGERLAEKSGGTVVLEIFPSEQLGSERETIEQVQLGCLDMTKSSAAALEQFVPEMAVYSVPYLFRDEAHCWDVLEGLIGREILAAGSPVGMKGLCYFDAGARSFYAKAKPIEHPNDLRGMKIRVQQSNTAMSMVESLGGSPTPIPWGELYTSLQQGVVDGAENNPPSFYTSRHYEVCEYYCLDEHTQVPDVLVMSLKTWETLSGDVQRMVAEAADEAAVFQRELWAKATAEALEKVAEGGVTVLRPEKGPFVEKVNELHASYEGTLVGELMRRIRQR